MNTTDLVQDCAFYFFLPFWTFWASCFEGQAEIQFHSRSWIFFFFLNLCEGIILMKSVHSLGWHSLGWKLLHFPEKLYLMKKLGQTLPYFSISISLCWAREVHQDWKGVSCLGHSDPTVSLYLVMGCRSTPFITDFWDIICWWHITPELCLPILVVANHNSSKKSTSIYWLKEKFPSTWSVSVSSLWDLCTEKW